MTSQLPIRPLVAAALSVLGMGGLSTAHAAYNGQVLTSTQVPGDVLINRDCMATLIAPRVALTSANCLSDSQARNPQAAPAGWAANRPYVKFHRARDGKAFNGTYVKFTETPVASVGDLAVVAFDQDVETDADVATRIIPSYADEALGVSEPAARTGKSGAGILSATNPAFLNNRLSLVTYARDSFNADSKADGKDAKGVAVSTFNPAGILAIRRITKNLVKAACSTTKACGETTPLQYQSIAASKSEFADLLNPDVEAPAIGRKNQLRRLYTEFKMTDDDVDDMLIVTPYRQQGNSSPPFAPGDQGAGLFGVGPNGREYLVGIASDNTTQVRLSHYWPWVYRTVRGLEMSGFLPNLTPESRADRSNADFIGERVLDATQVGYFDRFASGADLLKTCHRAGQVMYAPFVDWNSDRRTWSSLAEFLGKRRFFRAVNTRTTDDRSTYCVGSTLSRDNVWEIGYGELPDKIIAGTAFQSWEADREGGPKVGEIYLGNKGGYRLLKLLSSSTDKLAPLPDQASNDYWRYLGTGAGARVLKYQFGFPVNGERSTRAAFHEASENYVVNPDAGRTVFVLHAWSAARTGRAGDYYYYINPFKNNRIEYMRLKATASTPYDWFPIDGKSNRSWEALGSELPAGYPRLHQWGDNDGRGRVGDRYVYINPYNKNRVEFFELKEVDSSSRYGYFPIDGTSNKFWTFLGTNSPDLTQ